MPSKTHIQAQQGKFRTLQRPSAVSQSESPAEVIIQTHKYISSEKESKDQIVLCNFGGAPVLIARATKLGEVGSFVHFPDWGEYSLGAVFMLAFRQSGFPTPRVPSANLNTQCLCGFLIGGFDGPGRLYPPIPPTHHISTGFGAHFTYPVLAPSFAPVRMSLLGWPCEKCSNRSTLNQLQTTRP
jgi:hypothetical protein